MPLVCRASISVGGCKLYAAGEGDTSGGEITTEMRDELLGKLAAGAYVAIDADILAFEQRDGVSNRNFLRFRNESLLEMGRTGVGRPFLRDHDQHDTMAAAGRVLTSRTTKIADGQYELRQRVRLTATWAVELALRDLLFAVSIGWEPLGPVLCSACNAPVYTACYHWPGDRVTETPQADGSKKYLRDRNGALTVEWIYTKAALLETSMCPIGGVKLAGFEGVRAALSAAGAPHDDDPVQAIAEVLQQINTVLDEKPISAAFLRALDRDESTRSTPKPEGVSKMSKLDAAIAAHTELSADERKAFAAKLAASLEPDMEAHRLSVLAADPIVHTTKDGTAIRKSDGAVALMLAKQADAGIEREAAQAAQLATAQAAATRTALVSEASTLFAGCLGTNEDHADILGALKPLGDEKLRIVRGILAGGRAAPAPGVNPELGAQPDGPQAQFDALCAEHATKHSCSARDARLAVVKTEQGRALYNQIELLKKRSQATA